MSWGRAMAHFGSIGTLGGTYPSSCLYLRTQWVNGHRATVQKLVNAYVKTLKWINTHSAAQIADQMPADGAQRAEFLLPRRQGSPNRSDQDLHR